MNTISYFNLSARVSFRHKINYTFDKFSELKILNLQLN